MNTSDLTRYAAQAGHSLARGPGKGKRPRSRPTPRPKASAADELAETKRRLAAAEKRIAQAQAQDPYAKEFSKLPRSRRARFNHSLRQFTDARRHGMSDERGLPIQR